jgi:tetratricopeptide (TPR) repeat protein
MKARVFPFRPLLLMSAWLFSSAWLSAQSQHQSQPPVSPQAKTEAMELVKQGQSLNNGGKPDEAMALYQQALQLDPGLYDAHLYMGVTLDLQARYEEARLHLAKAIELANDQQTVQAFRVMAVSYAFERNTGKASEYERRAFDLQNNWGKYADAAGTADELARIYLESGDLDNAFQWYQTGHLTGLKNPSITPADKDLWEFRWEAAIARISARRGQADKAQQHLAAAKAILDKADNPDQARFYPYLAGYVALYSGDYKTAIADLHKANEQFEQKDPFVLSLLAQAYEKSGDKAQAIEYYKKALTINTHNPSNAFARPLAKEKLAALGAAQAAPSAQ